MTEIVRVIATHRREADEHILYTLRLDHVDVGGLQAMGYDLFIEPLILDTEDVRVKDAETLSFFAIMRQGW